MYAVNFEKRPGDLGVTAIVLADAPETALEKVSIMSRRYMRVTRQATVFEIKHAAIDWETGRNCMIQVERRPFKVAVIEGDPRQWPTLRDWREGSVYEFHVETGKASRWRDSHGGRPLRGRQVQRRAAGVNCLYFMMGDARPLSPGRLDAVVQALG